MDDESALAGGLRLVDLRQLLDIFLEQTQSQVQELAGGLGAQADTDRKRALLLFLHTTKQRLLRLLIVVKWANKARVVAEVGRILDVAARQANACRDAADQLAYLHGELEDTRVPSYDVPTALDILQTGRYDLLPSCIEELRPPAPPPPAVRRARLRLMDQILRSTLLKEKLPPGVAVESVGGGFAELCCGQEWEARLTLVPAPPPPPKEPLHQQDAEVGGVQQPEATQSRRADNGTAASDAVPGEPASATAEPMETDQQPAERAGAEAGPCGGKNGQPAVAGGVLDERWRWRVLKAKVLPQYSGASSLMAPQQASQLQGAIEMRMWAASEAAEEEQGIEGRQLDIKPEDKGSISNHPGPVGSIRPQTEQTGVKRGEAGNDAAAEPGAAAGERPFQQAPLTILHGILRDVGARLILNHALVWARAAIKEGTGRWEKLMRVEPAQILPMGFRMCYWLNVPTVTPADLQRLQQPELAPATAAPTAPLRPGQQPKQHTPPAIEVGIAQSGKPSVMACPELVSTATSTESPAGERSSVALCMDLVSLDAEEVLLRAAQANAAIQLAAIEALLRRSGNLEANIGAVSLRPPASSGVPSAAPVTGPVLELSCNGAPLLAVSVQLRTGRLLLRGGDGAAANFSSLGQELAPLLRQEEDRLAAMQAEALRQALPGNGQATIGMAAAEKLTRALETLWLNLSVRSRYSQLLAAAQHLGLHRAQIPPALLKAYAASNPLAHLPSKNVLFLAFPPTPPLSAPALASSLAGGEGTAGQERVDSLLGEGGCGMQLYLQAEMCRGLQWRYSLVVAGCNARNMPLKVLQAVPVPADVAARGQGSSSAGQAGSSAGQPRPPASGKRKRADDSTDAAAQPPSGQQQAGQEAAEDGRSEGASRQAASGGGGLEAPGGAQWGLRHAAELDEVVRWCGPIAAWELLRLQLKALGIAYTEEVSLAALLPAAAASALLPPVEAGGVSGADKIATAVAASGVVQRSLWLHGLHSLRLLDRVHGLSSPTGVIISLEEGGSQQGLCAWKVVVQSAYLAGLPASCAACSASANAVPGAPTRIAQTLKGLSMSYSFAAGATVESAVADVRCIIRLHLALARITSLMRAASPEASLKPADSAESHTHGAQRQMPVANGDLAKRSAAHPAAATSTKHSLLANGEATSAALEAVPGSHPIPLRWQVEEGCGSVSILAVGPSHSVLTVTSPEQAPDGNGKQLELSMEWAAKGAGVSGQPEDLAVGAVAGSSKPVQGSSSSIKCCMSSPGLPAAVLEPFEDMADAGEEEMLLDALSVCGCALAQLGAALAPKAVLGAGLLPEEVFLDAPLAPYKLRLRIVRGASAEVSMGLHLLAGGLVWLVPLGGPVHWRAELVNRLSRLPETFLPDVPSSAPEQEEEQPKGRGPQTAPSVLDSAMEIDMVSSPPQEAAAVSGSHTAAGLWVRDSSLAAAVRIVLGHAATGL